MKTYSYIALFTALIALAISTPTNAQDQLALNSSSYTTAVGLRAGTTSGLTIKHFTGNSTAVEGILGFWESGLSATVLAERYVTAFDVQGLNWYYGVGGHAALYGANTNNRGWGDGRGDLPDDSALGLGVDGILGLEYKIKPIPFAVSLDLKPFAEVTTTGSYWIALDPGLGVKVTF